MLWWELSSIRGDRENSPSHAGLAEQEVSLCSSALSVPWGHVGKVLRA